MKLKNDAAIFTLCMLNVFHNNQIDRTITKEKVYQRLINFPSLRAVSLFFFHLTYRC